MLRLFDLSTLCILLASFLLLAACTTERMTGDKRTIPGYSQAGSIGWNWNQKPHGGTDEKSSETPAEPDK